ncbi:hypothetical protein [Blastopirellula marina]|uniref:Uncharacterized protein n=1 Tax=Blastopirellula marina TaxID=124 RepID=A0A2S8GQJ4_9BACT|nr:hypothetical protein [Blastopirellula marina]PQO46703.1 hypothetical protein C5Y93_07665 [Blastopirellula marina]
MSTWIRQLAILGLLLLATGAAQAEPDWQLEKFPLPESSAARFQDLVIDETGSPWVLANNRVYYFDGEKFVALEDSQFKSGQYLTCFFGGQEEGAFLTQPGAAENEGKIFRLRADKCQPLTTFYYESRTSKPGLYVSNNRRLFNWGQAYLAVYDGNEWKRIEGQFGSRSQFARPVICDLGTDVYFYSTYDNRIYRCDGSNQLSVVDGPDAVAEQLERRKREYTYPAPVVTSTWNKDRVLLAFDQPPKLMAFDIRTKEMIDVTGPLQGDKRMLITDTFAKRDGSVWLLSPTFTSAGNTVHELAVDGTVTELTALRSTDWSNSIHRQNPGSMFETSDGDVVIAVQEYGISVYRDGQVVALDWRQGLGNGISAARPTRNDRQWLPYDRSGKGVMRIAVGAGEPPVDPQTFGWNEYKLAHGGQIWPLLDGEIVMFEADRPGELTRRTGDEVSYQKMPFETNRIFHSIVDDRGHLIVTVYPGKTYEISKQKVTEFERMEDALAAAVKDGAQRFRGSRGIGGAILAKDKRLWYLVHNANGVNMLRDGEWSTFRFRDDVYYLFESVDGEVIIRTQGGKLYRYDTGQMKEIAAGDVRRRDLMVGPRTTQAFDKELYAQDPDKYLLAMRDNMGSLRLYFDLASFEQANQMPAASPPGDDSVELPRYFDRYLGSRLSGGWLLMSQGAGAPYRVADKRLERVDFSETPLSGLWISDIYESPAGDIWFLSQYNQYPRAFQLKLSELTLRSDPIPQACGRELALTLDMQPERIAANVELFARVNDRPQAIERTPDGKVALRFPRSGEYRCRIGASRLGATAPKSLEFTVDASVDFPETVWEEGAAKAVTLTTVDWRPPVSAVPTKGERDVQLTWRIAGESWRKLEAAPVISLGDRAPGNYEIEFRASEADFWHDPSPVVVQVKYDPDFAEIIREMLPRLNDRDPEVRQAATAELQAMGPHVLPFLDRQIKETEEAIQALTKLKNLKAQIEYLERQKGRK